MITISVLNRKGGTGKTTCSVNIATIFASKEFKKIKKVLVIDLDPQKNASSTLQASYRDKESIYDVLTDNVDIKNAIIKTPFENVDILQASLNLDHADDVLSDKPSKEFILKQKLKIIENMYDYVIIDCPPSKNILTINALVASDFILIPMEAGKYAVDGIEIMNIFINEVKSKYNSNLKIAGVVLVKKERNLTQDGYASVIKTVLPLHIFNQVIRKSTIAEQSASSNEPLYYYNKNAPITQDFIKLSKEIYYITKGEK